MTKQQFWVGCAAGVATGLVLLGIGVPKGIAAMAGAVVALMTTREVQR